MLLIKLPVWTQWTHLHYCTEKRSLKMLSDIKLDLKVEERCCTEGLGDGQRIGGGLGWGEVRWAGGGRGGEGGYQAADVKAHFP